MDHDMSETPNVGTEPTTDQQPTEPDSPSCQGCRRRKLRCSREKPICSHCRRLDSPCVYDAKKNKPGIKAGAVGSLSRRVEALENALLEKTQEPSCCHHAHANSSSPVSGSQNVVEILSMLAAEIQKLNSMPKPTWQPLSVETPIHATASPSTSQASSRHTGQRRDSTSHANLARKRRRVDSCGNPNVDLLLPLEENLDSSTTSLPPADVLEDIINIYFDVIQPWIPILHETQFRCRIQEQDQLPQLVVILHAMVVSAVRFVSSNNDETRMTAEHMERWAARSRRFVVLTSMDGLSVENLQALIIVAFDDIGNGEASKAWSIIGSLTRTVEYLQLSVESDPHGSEPLLKPLPTIPGPKDWTEEEQRRRVFWNIFCLDRFCSVTTGWNTSLTSDDVQRRLPADGGLWHKEEAVTTPYFGIWDRSVAKIGNSIAFMPAYPSPEQTQDAPSATPARPGVQARSSTVDMTTVGAFAYRIEATESLSRTTTYFLQQRIDFHDRQQVSDWLTRFKELDLRLVHWKMFLPQRWRDSNISRQPALINMDPNLTLAHVTHNTSMILLHQRIAYPDPLWSGSFKLPSFCSAETCQVAAVETTTITQKYLKYTPAYSPVTNQYAFCVFISARVLLIHWRHYRTDLAPEFWILIEALDEMARRWAGPVLTHRASQSLAGKYAEQLRLLHSQCESDAQFSIDVLGYSTGMVQGAPSSPFFPVAQQGDMRGQHLSEHVGCESQGADGNVPVPDLIQQQPGLTPGADIHPDKLSAISHMLMDEDFMAMDRIISLDDMIFTAPEMGGSGLPWASNGDGQV